MLESFIRWSKINELFLECKLELEKIVSFHIAQSVSLRFSNRRRSITRCARRHILFIWSDIDVDFEMCNDEWVALSRTRVFLDYLSFIWKMIHHFELYCRDSDLRESISAELCWWSNVSSWLKITSICRLNHWVSFSILWMISLFVMSAFDSRRQKSHIHDVIINRRCCQVLL